MSNSEFTSPMNELGEAIAASLRQTLDFLIERVPVSTLFALQATMGQCASEAIAGRVLPGDIGQAQIRHYSSEPAARDNLSSSQPGIDPRWLAEAQANYQQWASRNTVSMSPQENP